MKLTPPLIWPESWPYTMAIVAEVNRLERIAYYTYTTTPDFEEAYKTSDGTIAITASWQALPNRVGATMRSLAYVVIKRAVDALEIEQPTVEVMLAIAKAINDPRDFVP